MESRSPRCEEPLPQVLRVVQVWRAVPPVVESRAPPGMECCSPRCGEPCPQAWKAVAPVVESRVGVENCAALSPPGVKSRVPSPRYGEPLPQMWRAKPLCVERAVPPVVESRVRSSVATCCRDRRLSVEGQSCRRRYRRLRPGIDLHRPDRYAALTTARLEASVDFWH